MATVEDILSNPGSNLFYLTHKPYFAIGNTRSVDLTEGCEVPYDTQFLLLASGDIRNILKTVHEVCRIKPLPKTLTFHVNDIDDVVLARNAVLIALVNTIDPSNLNDVKFLWNVWFNINLSENQCQRMKSILLDMLENPPDGVEFQSPECTAAIKRVVKYWLVKTVSVSEVQSEREKFVRKKAGTSAKKDFAFSEAVSFLHTTSGFMVNKLDPLKSGQRKKELENFFKSGSTDVECSGMTNVTLLCPFIDGWRVFHESLPFSGFNELLFDETMTLTQNCIQQLRAQLERWKEFKRRGGTVKVVLWHGDAMTLCHSRMPVDMKFDFINTADLCDNTTLLNVLLASSKHLKRTGVLTVQTMLLSDIELDHLDIYLKSNLDMPSSFYPTFLGLRLAEDFELGTSTFPRALSGLIEVTLRWLSAGESSPCIDLKESTNISRTFECLAKACFDSCLLNPTGWYNTPLTLVFLIKELSTKLKGGVKPLLEIVKPILPKKYTVSGEEFSPLNMEWKVLSMFHFPEESHLDSNDALVTVRVPVQIEWESLAPDLQPPAVLSVAYRALVMDGIENAALIAKKIYTVPWSTLSLVDYDYSTNEFRCILPKSDLSTFVKNTVIVPIGDNGGLLPLTLSGPFRRVDTLSLLRNKKSAEMQQQQPGDPTCNLDTKLLVKETEISFRVTVKPVQADSVLQSFNIQVDQTRQQEVMFRCKILLSKDNVSQDSDTTIKLPCAVEPPKSNTLSNTNMLDLKKSQEWLQGPMTLPLRRIDVSSQLLFPVTKKEVLVSIVGAMFTSEADIETKMLQTETKETLFCLKETIQVLMSWHLDPPESKPNVRAYRFLRGDHQRPKNYLFGYFPHDIFIGVRKLHVVNGLPTLDVVWMDFEIYRKQVPYRSGIDSREAEIFLLENSGSSLTPGTWSNNFISLEVSVLLKKILRLNTRKSVQNLKALGNPPWCFNSFLQPVYAVSAEADSFKLEGQISASDFFGRVSNESKTTKKTVSASSPQTNLWNSCTCCGSKKPDMRKCSRCKSVFYCSEECQTKDWENIHNKICRTLQALYENKQHPKHYSPEEPTNTSVCGFCGQFSSGLKHCTRCRNIAYCGRECQKKHWAQHKQTCSKTEQK